MPMTSVLSAVTDPFSSNTRVLATPSARTRGVVRSAARAARGLSGMVTEKPDQPPSERAAAQNWSQACNGTSRRVYCAGIPSAPYAASCSAGDRECPTG